MSRCCRSMAFFPASNFIFQSPTDISNETHHFPSLSSCLPSFSSQDFHGKRSVPFTGIVLGDPQPDNNNGGFGGEDELSDDGSHLLGSGEKKRRLNMEQVRTLEKNFELGNKLEPERKMQLAKSLGLQPRQIAIWFQNRRARWKTKQLEKDYESLKRQFDALKSDNDTLLALNRKLQSQIMALKGREPTESINLNKDTEGSSSNRSDNTSDIKLDISRTPTSAATAAFTAARVDSPVDISGGGPSMALFPTSSSMRPNGPVAQLFQSPHPRPADHHHHHHNHHHNSSFSNMFCAGIDDQTEFWPWIDQQNFN